MSGYVKLSSLEIAQLAEIDQGYGVRVFTARLPGERLEVEVFQERRGVVRPIVLPKAPVSGGSDV